MNNGITNQHAIDELLAFAAKAVSERYYKLVYVDKMGWIFEYNDGTRSKWFDPSVSDSDCMLLEAVLQINVNWDFVKSKVECSARYYNDIFKHSFKYNVLEVDTKLQARRLCSLMVAADIGRRVP